MAAASLLECEDKHVVSLHRGAAHRVQLLTRMDIP